jgi:hypothetical protein
MPPGESKHPNLPADQKPQPSSAVCTGTAPASFVTPGPAATTAASYVPNVYFSFPYIATYFANPGHCSAALSQCSANHAACITRLAGGGGVGGEFGVTIVVPGGGGTTIAAGGGVTYAAASATSICKIPPPAHTHLYSGYGRQLAYLLVFVVVVQATAWRPRPATASTPACAPCPGHQPRASFSARTRPTLRRGQRQRQRQHAPAWLASLLPGPLGWAFCDHFDREGPPNLSVTPCLFPAFGFGSGVWDCGRDVFFFHDMYLTPMLTKSRMNDPDTHTFVAFRCHRVLNVYSSQQLCTREHEGPNLRTWITPCIYLTFSIPIHLTIRLCTRQSCVCQNQPIRATRVPPVDNPLLCAVAKYPSK